MIWLVIFHRNVFNALIINGNIIVYIGNFDFPIPASVVRHLKNTREVLLWRRPNLHQVGDPIEKNANLFQQGYITVAQNLPFSLEKTVSCRNATCWRTAWSTLLSPSRWRQSGAVRSTPSVSCKKWHAHFRATMIPLDYLRTWGLWLSLNENKSLCHCSSLGVPYPRIWS